MFGSDKEHLDLSGFRLDTAEDFDAIYNAVYYYCFGRAVGPETCYSSQTDEKTWEIIGANIDRWTQSIVSGHVRPIRYDQLFQVSVDAPTFFEHDSSALPSTLIEALQRESEDLRLRASLHPEGTKNRVRVFPESVKETWIRISVGDTHGDKFSVKELLVQSGFFSGSVIKGKSICKDSNIHVTFKGDIVDRGKGRACLLPILLELWSRPENVNRITVLCGDHEDHSAKTNPGCSFMQSFQELSVVTKLNTLLPLATLFRGHDGKDHAVETHGFCFPPELKTILVLRRAALWDRFESKNQRLEGFREVGVSQYFFAHDHCNMELRREGVVFYQNMTTGHASPDSYLYDVKNKRTVNVSIGDRSQQVAIQVIQETIVHQREAILFPEALNFSIFKCFSGSLPQAFFRERLLEQSGGDFLASTFAEIFASPVPESMVSTTRSRSTSGLWKSTSAGTASLGQGKKTERKPWVR